MKREDTGNWKGNIKSNCIKNWLSQRLWTLRKTDCGTTMNSWNVVVFFNVILFSENTSWAKRSQEIFTLSFFEEQNRNAKVGQVSRQSCDSWLRTCVCVFVCVCVCVWVYVYVYIYIYMYPCHFVNAWFQKSCLNSWLYPARWIVTLAKQCVAVNKRLRTTV